MRQKIQPPKAPRPEKTSEQHDETVHQTRYREDVELDEYDEHKLQKMADDPTGSPAGGDGPDA